MGIRRGSIHSRPGRSERKGTLIHPFVSAGKPSLSHSGIMVEVIWRQKKDFRLRPGEIKAAIKYYAA